METPPNFEQKKSVPQIVEATGVSMDYMNEYTVLLNYIQLFYKNTYDEAQLKEAVEAYLDEGRPQTYTDRYPDDTYANVVHDENKDAVAAINRITTQFRDTLRTRGEFPFDEFFDTYNTLMREITGDDSRRIAKEDYLGE